MDDRLTDATDEAPRDEATRRKRKKGRRRRKVRLGNSTFPLLPSLMTLANGVCGLGAITLATAAPGKGAEESRLLFLAGLLVFVGMLFDMFDGQLARLTKQTSRFGMELDSLCDMITFGLAPVFIMLALAENGPRRLLWGIGALYAISAVLRLARFNVQKDGSSGTDFFRGLPTPAAAGAVASFAIALPALQELAGSAVSEAERALGVHLLEATGAAAPVLTLVLAGLMVSRLRYPHVANQYLTGRRSFYKLVELVFAAIAALTLHELAAPLIFCYYAFAPPLNQLRVKVLTRAHRAGEASLGLAGADES